MQINYDRLPHHMRDAMQRYVEHGIAPGSFLTAVLSNDLMGAMGRADDINRASLYDYAVFLRSNAPIGCWGSPQHVEDWIAEGGLNGLLASETEAAE